MQIQIVKLSPVVLLLQVALLVGILGTSGDCISSLFNLTVHTV